MSRRRVVIVGSCAWLSLSGCSTDLRVGVDTEGGSGDTQAAEATSSGGGANDGAGPAGAAEASGSGGDAGSGSSGMDALETTTTMGVGSSGEAETSPEPTTTTGEVGSEAGVEATGEPTGDPPPPCTAEGQEQCLQDPICVWVRGVCAIDPCEDPENDCLALGYRGCVDAPGCAWVGVPERGECGAIACVPCEVLDAKQCAAVESCEYVELEMACVEI